LQKVISSIRCLKYCFSKGRRADMMSITAIAPAEALLCNDCAMENENKTTKYEYPGLGCRRRWYECLLGYICLLNCGSGTGGIKHLQLAS
jgi:hypothetical protein